MADMVVVVAVRTIRETSEATGEAGSMAAEAVGAGSGTVVGGGAAEAIASLEAGADITEMQEAMPNIRSTDKKTSRSDDRKPRGRHCRRERTQSRCFAAGAGLERFSWHMRLLRYCNLGSWFFCH